MKTLTKIIAMTLAVLMLAAMTVVTCGAASTSNGTVTGGEDFVFAVPTLRGYVIGVEVRINGVEFSVEIVDGKGKPSRSAISEVRWL